MTHPTQTTYRPPNYRAHVRPQPATARAAGDPPLFEARWVEYSGPGAHPAGLIPARPEAPARNQWRERPRARTSVTATMYAIYVTLLLVAASFGVLAAYQWERRADVLAYAGMMDSRNHALQLRVRDLESANQSLVAAAADAQEEATYAKLRADAAQKDDVADPAQKDDADPAVPNFETASGGQPSMALPAVPSPEPASPQSAPLVAPTAAAIVPPTAQPAADPAPAPPAAKEDDPIIVIQAKEETWIQVQDGGGKPLFTRLMKQGETYTSMAEAGAKLITGNPTGLKVSVNAEPAPAFAEKGPRRREIALDPAKLMTGSAEIKK